MQALKINRKQTFPLILLGLSTFASHSAIANSDMQMMREVQKAREAGRTGVDHSQHKKKVKESEKFRGIFYGYLPCKDCDGIKTTLSLKNKNNYLLVTQYAKTSTREFFEKGKYTWDEKNERVILTPRKGKKSVIRKYYIKNDGALVLLNEHGKAMKNKDKYTLLRSDMKKTRTVHIH